MCHISTKPDIGSLAEVNTSFSNGIKETILTEGKTIYALFEHLARASDAYNTVFCGSAKSIDFQEYAPTIRSFVEQSYIKSKYGRLNLFFSNAEKPNQSPRTAFTLKDYQKPSEPYTAITYQIQNTIHSPSPTIKWVHSIRNKSCMNHAIANNKDLGVFIDANGFLLEGHHSNIFFLLDGGVYTPPIEGILPGTTRQLMLSQFPNIQERQIHLTELSKVSALWASNSLIGTNPISNINDLPIPTLSFLNT